jgi:hypothetical protein
LNPYDSNLARTPDLESFTGGDPATGTSGGSESQASINRMSIDWKNYQPGEFYDELVSSPGYARAPARNLMAWLRSLSDEELQSRKVDAELAIIDKGVTFTVYSDG